MERKHWIVIILITLLLLSIVVVIYAYSRYRLNLHIISLYNQEFQHPPDILTHRRWVHNWKSDRGWTDYVNSVHESVRACATERVIFVGLCQDHGKELIEYWLPFVEAIGQYCKDYRILILENDSKDGTRKRLLQETMRNPKILILCDDESPLNKPECKIGLRSIQKKEDKENDLPNRLHIMAQLRDTYMRRIARKWSKYDRMVVIDWDLMGELSVEGFFHAMGVVRTGEVDAVAVNSMHWDKKQKKYRIFDTFPLLSHKLRCDALFHKKTQMDTEIDTQYRDRLACRQKDLMMVESAFGGICIYNLQRVMETSSRYFIPENERRCPIQCEHSTFHRYLRVAIDPWFMFLLSKNLH
jgi:hypothetical protein